MNLDRPPPRLAELFAKLADEMLDAAEAAELDAILRHDPVAREHYRWHVAVHSALMESGRQGKLIPLPPPRQSISRTWLAVAAAIALTAGIGGWWRFHPAAPSAPPLAATPPAAPSAVLAVVSLAHNAQWNLPNPPATGQGLRPGPVQLLGGDLTLAMVGGQTLALRGPAEFELLTETEFALRRGDAAFRDARHRGPFIMQVPFGAVVDLGTEFSAHVAADGVADVRVFEGEVTASTISASGTTREEVVLNTDQTVCIAASLTACQRPAGAFIRTQAAVPTDRASGMGSYALAVKGSSPLAYWRFEQVDGERQVRNERDGPALQLAGNARLEGSDSQRFMVVGDTGTGGFASTRAALAGLDTARGITVECLLYPLDERYGSVIAFELADPPPADLEVPGRIHHAPQTFALERMGRRGEHIGHVHPDYALRAMFRSPAGYVGGTNVYSRESHLLYRWIHAAVTHDGERIRLYIDGELSDEATTKLPFQNANLRPIIGRLQPDPRDEARQWIGGIDEVALYGRVLAPAEIRAHATALAR